MAHRPTLAGFVDQELRLSDATFAAIVDAVLEQWRERASGRMASDAEALRLLQLQRDDFIACAVQSLRDQISGRASPAGLVAPKSPKLELSLVDDDEISADIEVARIVERSNADLEEPLRELRTYTSSLVGDVNTARDTNPLRPDAWVRAVLAGLRRLPIERRLQTAMLRTAMQPLIRALHDHYTAASARLHALGVAPAAHRTVVNEGVVTELTEAMRVRRSLDRDTAAGGLAAPLPGSVEELLQRVEQGLTSPRHPGDGGMRAAPATPAPREQPSVERLSNLYDAILSDRRLPRDSLPLLSRLYPAVLRQTLADAGVLGDAKHAVWQFMDQLGFLMQTREVGDRQTNLAFAQGLVEQLVAQPSADARSFQAAANRLVVLERQRFARAVAAAAAEIAMLGARTHDDAFGHSTSVPQSLDPGSSDTLQAPLRRNSDATAEPDDVVRAWRAGSWLSIFLREQWRRALILWRAPSPGPLLLLDASAARHWALRSAAVERLAGAGLARVFSPRSLVRDASGRVGQVARDPGPTLFG
ncbi:MAG: hypothetical protein LKCHEGNO_01799 [Burkholderiaceae bacterium]|nr:hypothetical protein [Burkholderiaceae bacterium]